MSTIQATILAFSTSLTKTDDASKKSNDASGFDALLKNMEADKKPAANDATGTTDILNSIQSFLFNIDATLFDIGNSDQAGAANNAASNGISALSGASDDGGISVDALLNQGGPLPEFLDRVAARYGLDDAHKQALRNVAIQFKDTTGSPAEIAAMGDALKAAGIGLTA